MKQTSGLATYAKKPVSPRSPRSYKTLRSGSNRHRTSRHASRTTTSNANSFLKSLSSINLVSILNSFYTIRSTVKDLRTSLERLDHAMDSAYQMFEIAQTFIKDEQPRKSRPPLQLLPSPKSSAKKQQALPDRSSRTNREKPDDGNAPFAGLFDQIDIGQLMSVLQSPIVQGMLKQFIQGGAQSGSGRKRKEG